MRVGFVGLGAMGDPMARNLHSAGLLAAVYNRSPGKAQLVAQQTHCEAARDLGAVARLCDAVVLCLPADADVLRAAETLSEHLAEGSLIMDCSTVNPATARRAEEILSRCGAGFLDCPVSGGTEGARNATLAIMVGGQASDFGRAEPVLRAMGKSVEHMGPVGAGQATKAINQIMIAGINQAVTESLAFAEAEDLPLDKLIDIVASGAAGNWFLDHRGTTMVRREYPLGFKVSLHHKDLEICQTMAAEHDVRLPLVEMTLKHYERLLAQGFVDEDISSLFRLKAALFDKKPAAD